MSQSSQTESEPEDLQVTRWDPMDLVKIVTEDSRERSTQDYTSQLRDALQTLQDLDICALERDDSLHEILQVVSSTILYHLDQIVQIQVLEDGDVARMRVILLSLLDISNLSLLFEFRAAFHRIAARNADGPSTSVIVCWADAILAKLGQTIIFASGALYNVTSEDRYQPLSVRDQKEDDMLRAAVQLPDKWSELVHVLTSEYVSPAAYRLALSLLFGAHVMRPQLCGEQADADPRLFDTLNSRIKRSCDKRREGVSLTSTDVSESERIAYAMFVSLYAVLSSNAGQDVVCKPQTQHFLLEMIQAVLQPDTVLSPITIMTPRTGLDTAFILLTKWGTTMPWAWTTWEDAKIFNCELIEHFTTSWLYTLDNSTSGISVAHSIKYWDDGLVTALQKNSYAALSMIARLMLCGLSVVNVSPAASLPAQVQDVLLKLCWSTRYLFKLVEIDHASTIVLLSMLCKYFVRLPDNETGLAIKDLIIDILSCSQVGLKGALDAVCGPQSEFALNLERNLERISHTLKGKQRSMTMPELRAIRQNIQFVTLMWMSDNSRPTSVLHSIRLFLTRSLRYVETQGKNSLGWSMLGDALVVILTVLERRRTDPVFRTLSYFREDSFIQSVSQETNAGDLVFASSFALYTTAISTRLHDCDALVVAESWDYLRDVLLLIMTSDFDGLEEPLALLVAPAICAALLALLRYSDKRAVQYCISSPWTTCVLAHLKNLRSPADRHGDEDYLSVLCERINPTAKLLCQFLESPDASVKSCEPAEPVGAEPVFVWMGAIPYLVLIAL